MKLTSPRVSPAKNHARREEEEKKEEEEASNRVSPLPMMWRCRIYPRDEGTVNIGVGALEVPAIEVVLTTEVPAIEAEGTRDEATEGGQAPASEGGGQGRRVTRQPHGRVRQADS